MQTRPTLNIWRAVRPMTITLGNGEVTINARELLFLIDKNFSFFTFATEKGQKVKISIKAEEEGKVEKIF